MYHISDTLQINSNIMMTIICVDNIVILLNSLYIVTRLQLDKVVTWLKTCQFQGYHKVLAR